MRVSLVSSKVDDRTWSAIMLFGAVALLISVVVSVALFNRSLRQQTDAIIGEGEKLAATFNYELSLHAFTVEAMGAMARDLLEQRTRFALNPVELLYPVPEKGGYAMRVPRGYRAEEIGNLTGFGRIPAADSFVAREMAMAMALSPIFGAVTARNPDLPWVYYTSAQHFIYLFPRVETDEFFYTTTLHEKHFYRGALPSVNPSRKVFWSPVYLDEAGKGLMVTVSKPVYAGDAFLGTLSIDIGVKTLTWLLERYPIPHSTVHLVSPDGAVMVNQDGLPPKLDLDAIPLRMSIRSGDAQIAVFPLQAVNWYIVVRTTSEALRTEVYRQSVIHGLVVLLLLSSLALLAMLSRTLERLRLLSIKDGLTGIDNRRHFDAIARAEFARIRRVQGILGLIIIDIDNFKAYNDCYGHQAGDLAIKSVARCLQNVLWRESDKVFRIGGEEFAVLTLLENTRQLEQLSEKLGAAVRALDIAHKESASGRITVSIGAVAVDTGHWMDMDAAYRMADAAMYEAKDKGRDRIEVRAAPKPIGA